MASYPPDALTQYHQMKSRAVARLIEQPRG